MSTRIVTDSACDVPANLAAELGIAVVPVYINIGDRSFLEGVDLSRQDFYKNLPKYQEYPTTAAPSSGAFRETYERLAREGATEILSIHIASNLSATLNAARLGAEACGLVPVTLFDSRQITLGAGLLVVMAAEAAAAGRKASEIVDMLAHSVKKTHVFGMIDNLTALRRSGRVSWAEFGMGTLLQIKPVMIIHDGEIQVAAKIRTKNRAVRQMMKMVENLGPFERMAVIHVNAGEAAEELLKQAAHLFPDGQPRVTTIITPAIGTHLGQGALGFACVAKG